MINFRYHVVSLTAVFLALAIGLVVGTAALNGPLSDALNDRVNALGKDNKQLREQVSHLEEQADRVEDFAIEAAPLLLAGRLAGRRVLLVSLPSGRNLVKGVTEMLTATGATITGHVQIQDKFTDPARAVELLDLADQALPATIPATGIPANSDGVETSAALLAAVLLDRTPVVTEADRRAVLTAYTEASYISVDDADTVTGPAEAVVILDGLPYVDREAGEKNDAVVTTVAQFDQAGLVVVGSSGAAGGGNVVTEVRDDPTLAKTVSTVDNASTPQGQVATALAAIEQLVSHRAGQYGTGAGASSMLPEQSQ